MFGQRRLGLVAAVVLGLGAAFLVWSYTQRLQTQLRLVADQSKQQQVNVLVAARDIPAHTPLTPDLVKVVPIAASAKLPQALTLVKDVQGKLTRYPVAAGEQILPMNLEDQYVNEGLAGVVPTGKLAMAIQVTEIIAVGGLLAPGDHVDVLASFDQHVTGQQMAEIIAQNLDVLAVAQTYEGEQSSSLPTKSTAPPSGGVLPGGGLKGSPAAASSAPTTAGGTALSPNRPPPQPLARTVTLAVTPRQAEELILAEQEGHLRLALRSPRDSSIVEVSQATLSTLRGSSTSPTLQLTSVKITPTIARLGETLTITMTVKNVSSHVVHTEGPNPDYVYTEGQTFDTQKFASQPGAVRVGVSFAGPSSTVFPYRWGLGGDLAPGASRTIVGAIKLTQTMKPTNVWAGVVQEPNTILQDNIGTIAVTVAQPNAAVVSIGAAEVRGSPDLKAQVLDTLRYGTSVSVVGQQKDWLKVKLPDGRIGFVSAGWITLPTARQGG